MLKMVDVNRRTASWSPISLCVILLLKPWLCMFKFKFYAISINTLQSMSVFVRAKCVLVQCTVYSVIPDYGKGSIYLNIFLKNICLHFESILSYSMNHTHLIYIYSVKSIVAKIWNLSKAKNGWLKKIENECRKRKKDRDDLRRVMLWLKEKKSIFIKQFQWKRFC